MTSRHPPDRHDADPFGDLRERYVRTLLQGDAIAARGIIEESLASATVEDAYLRVVAPALHDVGVLWERDLVSVAEEHLATSVSEVIIADLAGRLPAAPRRNLTAVVACAPGEQHSLGSRVVADFLDAGGFDVLHLGAMTPGVALAELAVARHASVVSISVSTPMNVPQAADAVGRLKALPYPPVVALGGRAFPSAQTALNAGADLTAASPPELVRLLGERFAGRPA